MTERVWSEKDLARRAKRRLAVLQHAEEVSGNVAATCRYYGISRTVFYRWRRRFEEEGLDGLKDRSSAPVALPERDPARGHRQDHPPAAALPLRAAEDRDVPEAVPRRRDQPLRRVADPQAAGHEPTAGLAALQAPPAALEALREAAARPPGADRRQVHRADHQRTQPRKRYYQYTAIDDCTRLRVLRIYPRSDQKTAIQFLDYVLARLPVQGREDPDRQRRRVPVRLPLARPRPGHRPHLHPPGHATAQRQGRAIPPHRRRGVLPPPRRRRHRRRRAVQRQAPRVGGLLQLPPTPRRPRRPNPLRKTTTEDQPSPSPTNVSSTPRWRGVAVMSAAW